MPFFSNGKTDLRKFCIKGHKYPSKEYISCIPSLWLSGHPNFCSYSRMLSVIQIRSTAPSLQFSGHCRMSLVRELLGLVLYCILWDSALFSSRFFSIKLNKNACCRFIYILYTCMNIYMQTYISAFILMHLTFNTPGCFCSYLVH